VSHPSSGSKKKPSMKPLASSQLLLHAGFLCGLLFDPEDGGDVPPRRRLTFNGLYGITSQKTELFTLFLVKRTHCFRNWLYFQYQVKSIKSIPFGPSDGTDSIPRLGQRLAPSNRPNRGSPILLPDESRAIMFSNQA
jgi:hypothetical protein